MPAYSAEVFVGSVWIVSTFATFAIMFLLTLFCPSLRPPFHPMTGTHVLLWLGPAGLVALVTGILCLVGISWSCYISTRLRGY